MRTQPYHYQDDPLYDGLVDPPPARASRPSNPNRPYRPTLEEEAERLQMAILEKFQPFYTTAYARFERASHIPRGRHNRAMWTKIQREREEAKAAKQSKRAK